MRRRRNAWPNGFIGWIGNGYNALGRFPKNLTELNDACQEFDALSRTRNTADWDSEPTDAEKSALLRETGSVDDS